MKDIFERAIAAEFVKVFGLALAVFALFIMGFYVMNELSDQCLGFKHSALLVPYLLPHVLRVASQGAILFAACFVYGRMSADNEIVALKAAGISPFVIFLPALTVGLAASVAGMWLYDLGEGWGRECIYGTCVNYADKVICEKLHREKSVQLNGLTVAVQDVNGCQLTQPIIWFLDQRTSKPVCITAKEGLIFLVADKLSLTLRESSITMGDRMNGYWPKTFNVELESPVRRDVRIVTHRSLVRKREAVRAIAGDLEQAAAGPHPNPEAIRQLDGRLQEAQAELRRMEIRFHHKFANAFSCLFFVMVGAPLAVRLRTASFLSTFFLCFVPLVTVYHPLLLLGKRLAFVGAFPAQGVWLCNAVVGVVGGWLTWKAVRH